MKLFQYWDTGEPPDDVAGWVESFRVMNPEMQHRLFSRDDAAWFINKRLGQRYLKAFEACAVPAMQADYFRLCHLAKYGGFYVDADFRCIQPLRSLVEATTSGLMPIWDGRLVNCVWLQKAPSNDFALGCLALATANIEERAMPNVYTATGPGVMDAVRAVARPELAAGLVSALDNPMQRCWRFDSLLQRARELFGQPGDLRDAYDHLSVVKMRYIERWMTPTLPKYKETGLHWLNWEGPIYLDQQVPVDVS